MLILRVYSYNTSKTQNVVQGSSVILLRVTKLLNLTREFYLVLYELITLIDTCEQQEFHWERLGKSHSSVKSTYSVIVCIYILIDYLASTQSKLGMLSKIIIPRRSQYAPESFY